MSLARVVVTAVIVEGRSKTQVAKDYGVVRSWVYELLKRFEAEGEAAFEPPSRKPHSNPRTTSHEVEGRILFWRTHFSEQGFDAGAHTIAYALPASVLSDNAAVFTARMRGGRNAFETEMASLNMVQKILALIIHKLVAKWSVFIKP